MTFLTTVTNNGSPIATALFLLLTIAIHWIPLLILFILLVKALIKYLRTGEIRKEKAATRKNLGEALKEQRLRCQMTQEFVAERLGVSRQAVSK